MRTGLIWTTVGGLLTENPHNGIEASGCVPTNIQVIITFFKEKSVPCSVYSSVLSTTYFNV